MTKTNESRFLAQLEKIVSEQERLAKTEILPQWAVGLGEWLTVNPWRVIAPAAGILYLAFRIFYGVQFRELILAIFGGY